MTLKCQLFYMMVNVRDIDTIKIIYLEFQLFSVIGFDEDIWKVSVNVVPRRFDPS